MNPTTATVPSILSKDSTSATPSTDVSSQNIKTSEIVLVRPGPRRGRKRIHHLSEFYSEIETKKIMLEPKNNKEKEKEDKGEKEPKDQIQLQELYYATMEGNRYTIFKEHKSSIHFKVRLNIVPSY